jgi:hypothetical protein
MWNGREAEESFICFLASISSLLEMSFEDMIARKQVDDCCFSVGNKSGSEDHFYTRKKSIGKKKTRN